MSAAALLSLSRALHKARNLQDVFALVRQSCQAHTRFDRVYTQLPSRDRRSMEVVGYVLPDVEMVRRQVASVELEGDRFLAMALGATEPLVVPDCRLHPLANQAQVEAFGLRTAIVIPMLDGDEQIGPFNVATFADQGVVVPTDEEMSFLVQVASLVGVVIGRLRAEEAREELERKLLSTQKLEALGRLAGEVAHDFNNLLLAVLGNAELAVEDLQEHPALEYVTDIRSAALRASALSRQLLAFSKGQVMSTRVLQLAPLVEGCLQMLQRLVPSGVEIAARLGRETGSVKGDPGQLEQIVMNLVLNARDALPRGGHIAVETQNVVVDEEFIANHASVAPGRYVLLTVTDDGEGMDQDTQRRVFEPFFTTKAADKGTGLGLSVVQGIVAQHRGHIHLYSEPGLGTAFKVYLPMSEQRAVHVGNGLPPRPRKFAGTERVLVVDDEAHVRRTVGAVLRRAGYDVTIAEGSEQALRLCAERRPDLLLSDIVMPGADGLGLATEVSATHPEVKVLLMTGYAPAQLQEVPWPHITKPFTPSELMGRMRALFDEA